MEPAKPKTGNLMMNDTVSDKIMQRLEKETTHAFCVVGGGSIFLTDALSRSQIKPVFLLHEQACAIAADAYAQATGRLGLVIVTTGPGVTNAMTGVAASYIDSTPVMVLSGQVNTFHSMYDTGLRQRGIQEVDTVSLVSPIVKRVWGCFNPPSVLDELETGIQIALEPRCGPVWLDVPLDIQKAVI